MDKKELRVELCFAMDDVIRNFLGRQNLKVTKTINNLSDEAAKSLTKKIYKAVKQSAKKKKKAKPAVKATPSKGTPQTKKTVVKKTITVKSTPNQKK